MARPSIIRKTAADFRVAPHWTDYERGRAGFSWDRIQNELGGSPGGGINMAHAAVERHLAGAEANHVAFRFLKAGGQQILTYTDLSRLCNRFANVLA
jgi:acetyl-CoA synthetase